jgi:chemotaxis response regulator CheB
MIRVSLPSSSLSADRESPLDEVIARLTPIPVIAVSNGLALEPNRIYLLTGGVIQTVEKRRLARSQITQLRHWPRLRADEVPIETTALALR